MKNAQLHLLRYFLHTLLILVCIASFAATKQFRQAICRYPQCLSDLNKKSEDLGLRFYI